MPKKTLLNDAHHSTENNPILLSLVDRLKRNDSKVTKLSTRRLPLSKIEYRHTAMLLQAMLHNTSVKHVDIELRLNVEDDEEDCFETLKAFLVNLKSPLHTLTVTSWTRKGFRALCRALQHVSHTIGILVLGDCRLGSIEEFDEHNFDGELLARALQHNKVAGLTIQGVSLSNESVDQLSKGLHNTKLQELHLNQVETDPGSWGLLLRAQVRKLVVSSCDLGLGLECAGMKAAEHPLYLLMAQEFLEHLEIKSCGLDDYAAFIMTRGTILQRSRLRLLDLSDNNITTGVHLGQLLRYCSRLTAVNFSENPLNADAWRDLCISLSHHPSLEEFYLRNTGSAAIEPSVAKVAAQTFGSLPQLKVLDLSEHAWGESSDVAINLFEIVSSRTLETVVFQSCRMDADSLVQFLSRHAAVGNVMLQELDWSRNDLSRAGSSVADAIDLCNLRQLDLSSCKISDTVICDLAPALCNATISSLALSMNQIGNQGCKAFGKSMESATSLQTVDLSLNLMDARGLEFVVRALDKNCTLRRLFVLNALSFRDHDVAELSTNWKCLTEKLNHITSLNRAGRNSVVDKSANLPQVLQCANTEYGINGLFYQLQRNRDLLVEQ